MTVVPSTVVAIGGSPGPDDVSDAGVLLAPDWTPGVVVRTAWSTAVVRSKTDREQRRGLADRPVRSVEYRTAAFGVDEVRAVLSEVRRSALSRWLVPLVSDVGAAEYRSGLSIYGDFAHRRLFAGARVALLPGPGFGLQQHALAVLDEVYDNRVVVDAVPAWSAWAGVRVVPLIEARLAEAVSAAIETDDTLSVSLVGQELAGQAALPGCYFAGANPGLPSYSGSGRPLPVLVLWEGYGEGLGVEMRRSASYARVGRSEAAEVYGTRPLAARTMPVRALSRAEAWRIVRLFDSRCGRVHPFWVVSPLSEVRAPSRTASGFSAPAVGPEGDWARLTHVAAVLPDGTAHLRRVTGVVRSAGVDAVTLDSPFPALSDGGWRLGAAELVRFASDELEERWIDLDLCELSVSVEEVVADGSVDVPNLVRPATAALPWSYSPGLCDEEDTSCDDACGSCGCCRFSAQSTVSLQFTQVDFNLLSNGLSVSLADYLRTRGPFVLPYVGSETFSGRSMRKWQLTLSALEDSNGNPNPDASVTLVVRFDCKLRQWRWGYSIERDPASEFSDFAFEAYEPDGNADLFLGQTSGPSWQSWNNLTTGPYAGSQVPCSGLAAAQQIGDGIFGRWTVGGRVCCPVDGVPMPIQCDGSPYAGWAPPWDWLSPDAACSGSPPYADSCWQPVCGGVAVTRTSALVGVGSYYGDPDASTIKDLEGVHGRLCYITNYWENVPLRAAAGDSSIYHTERIVLAFADGTLVVYTGRYFSGADSCTFIG